MFARALLKLQDVLRRLGHCESRKQDSFPAAPRGHFILPTIKPLFFVKIEQFCVGQTDSRITEEA